MCPLVCRPKRTRGLIWPDLDVDYPGSTCPVFFFPPLKAGAGTGNFKAPVSTYDLDQKNCSERELFLYVQHHAVYQFIIPALLTSLSNRL